MTNDRTRIEVEGMATVLGQLRALDRKVKRKIMRKATNAGAKELHKEARRLAPRTNGFLRMSLKVVIKAGKNAVFAKIGQEKNKQFNRKRFKGSGLNKRGYAAPIWWIERGTKRHAILASKRALAWTAGKRKGSKGKPIFAKSIKHPGSRAQRLLERAGRMGGPAAARIWMSTVSAEMAKIPRPGDAS